MHASAFNRLSGGWEQPTQQTSSSLKPNMELPS